MLRIGLTGGLATGKSFVGHALEELGCHLLKADDLGHRVLAPGGAAFEPVIAAFGRQILNSGGLIDRRALGALVFASREKLDLLNSLVHPAVFAEEQLWLERLEREDPSGIALYEAAILIETGSFRRYQKLILTVCTAEQQIERAIKRDHLTRQDVLERLGRQMSLEEKRKYADFVIDTSGEKETTLIQVRRLHGELRALQS